MVEPSDWQTYQAARTQPGAPNQQTAPPYGPQAYGGPAGKKTKSRILGWPLVILLLGLAIIGSCMSNFSAMIDKAGSSFTSISALTVEPSLGVLVIENEIMGSVWVTTALNKFKEDPNIRAVVIRIDSPGGSVAPCQEIYTAVKDLGKPVVVSMGSVAASGGLYIAAAGDVVMANPGTITGSIGVIMQNVEMTGTMEKIGLKSQVIKSGEFKDMGSPFREMRTDEKVLLEKMVMEVYEQFVNDLSAGRPKMKKETVRALADGRIYSGADAAKLGLVDELGGFEQAIVRAAQLGKMEISGRPALVIEDGRGHWWEMLMQSKAGLGITVPPALQPGFSMKYIYQPDLN